MSNLVEFGDVNQPLVEQTFGYFGERLRLNPEFSELELLDFMEAAGQMDEADPKAIIAVKGFFRKLVHADDFDTFWTTAKKHQQGVANLMELVSTVIEALTGRPTKQPSSSSAGLQEKDVQSSKPDSYSQAIQQLAGRPDLQEAVVQRREALHAV